MGRAIICQGDPTSHGGKVLEGDPDASIDGRPIALRGHMTFCPLCKGKFPIQEGLDHHSFGGIGTAVEGMKTACGATLIATQHLMTVDEQFGDNSTGVYDADLGDDISAAETEVSSRTPEPRPTTDAAPNVARPNSIWTGAGIESVGPMSKASQPLFRERQYEAVYKNEKFIGIRNAMYRSKPVDDDTSKVQLNTLESIRSLIAEQKMNAILEFPTSYGATSFSPKYNGPEKIIGERIPRTKPLGTGHYDSTMEVYLNGNLKGTFTSRSIPSDRGKFATIQEGYYIAEHHLHQGKYAALQLVNPGENSNGTFTPAENISQSSDLGSGKIPTIGKNPAHQQQAWASGINIHHAGINDFTGITTKGTGVSEGCQVVASSDWEGFSDLIGEKRNGKFQVPYFNVWVIRTNP